MKKPRNGIESWRERWCEVVARLARAGVRGEELVLRAESEMREAGYRAWVVEGAVRWFRAWMRSTARATREARTYTDAEDGAFAVGILRADGAFQPMGFCPDMNAARYFAEVLWCMLGPERVLALGKLAATWADPRTGKAQVGLWPDPNDPPRRCPWGGPVVPMGVGALVGALLGTEARLDPAEVAPIAAETP